MKQLVVVAAALVLSAASVPAGLAQSGAMKGMDMDHKDMDMGKDKSGGADKKSPGRSHKGVGVVKKVDAAKGTVTLAHDPIGSLNWAAMTMTFQVKDKKSLEKLSPEKKVEFEFVQQGSGYVITRIK
jgi:Cu(I)/Ag(I) efflux system protein CusF